ncbi:hypothetical protein SOCE26_056270 [Sorangium cellulosum]|uniref:Tetratricopeptide repeat protein n=1 Tax=Sorangium cellulosum TaxID=56 RepID=A0A2L0EXX9_SORCE|nr:hypothetical protein [Sorangium cellulosum]AUX44164.1 hypothetical protein SOCE26_056270 [Sorangium cellulosum]
MPPLLRSPAIRITAALVAVAMALVGLLPLFDGPGYESALAAGLLVPSAAAIATALDIAARRSDPALAFRRGVATGALLAAVAYATTLAHGLRAGFCDVLGGSAHFALGPGLGALLGGAWGAVAGEIAAGIRRDDAAPPPPTSPAWRRRLVAVLAALAAPLGSAGVSVVRFYTSPIVFAYDPFAGYFSGTFYDTIVDASGLLTYRAGTLATLVAAAVLAHHLAHDADGRLAFQRMGRPGLLLLGAASAALSAATLVEGARLGHFQTSETIAAELGALTAGRRCEVVHPRGMRAGDVQRFVRECDAHVEAGERWLGAPAEAAGEPLRVRAYLFESAAQKGALMGASRTYIAKPWRREVYLQAAGYPHPTLGHEVMHVLAGAFARGPFQVAGRLGGWLPDPGLIEGIAVAGSPREGEDLSPRAWAKAMKDLGILPPLSRLFALGFLAENSSTAYTVSGAFVGHVRDKHGPAAVRAWYGGEPLPEITGASWAELERAWHAELDALSLPDAARAQAKARFDRPALFERRCPHVVDACAQKAEQLRARGDHAGAIAEYQRILELDRSPATRVAIAETRLASEAPGAREDAVRELEGIAGDAAIPRHLRDRAAEELGDVALAAGDRERAVSWYREVAGRLVDEDRLRTLDVKIAAAHDERARAAVVELLIGTRGGSPDRVRAAELLGAWAAQAPGDGLPSYLLGRHYLNDGRFDEAADRLDRALAAHLPVQRVWIEAKRLRLVAACALGDAETARRMSTEYAAHDGEAGAGPAVSEERRDAALRLLERCAWAAAPGSAPPAATPGGAAGEK